jgi:tRNA(Ile)-lysidine synthetase-like protein
VAVDVADVVKQKVAGITSVVIGLSGGIDSMVLAHILSCIPSLTVVCAHVDHQVRPESRADAGFVQEWCRNKGIRCEVQTLDQCPKGTNLEAWARKQRYAFFNQVCIENSGDVIVTAHHADDVVETLLMRLFANKEIRTIDERIDGAGILRPLLTCTKKEIAKYASDNEVAFVEDTTNTDQKFIRNRFRHSILPFLRHELGDSIDAILLEQAGSLDIDLRYLRESADEVARSLEKYPRYSREWLRQCCAMLGGLPEVLRWRAAEGLLIQDLGFRVGRRHSQRFVRFMLEDQSGIELPGGVTIRRKNGGLERERLEEVERKRGNPTLSS